jgi:thiol-disulfide isomerase/thioredoxin
MMVLWLMAAASAAPEMIPAEVFDAVKNASTPTADDVSLPMQDGSTFHLTDAKGHDLVVAFWASWCAPCRHELPALSKWAKANPDVRIVAVNVDRDRKDADRFVSAVRFDLPVGYDPDAKQLGRYGVTSMPTMFLFDENGVFQWSHTGFSAERQFQELDRALRGPEPTKAGAK